MATNKELMAEIAALRAQLEEMKSQPVVVHEKIVYVDRTVEGKVPNRQLMLACLFKAEWVGKSTIQKETGLSSKSVDSYKCYLNEEGWNIVLKGGKYTLEDSPNFRKFAALDGAPEWMRMKLELIIARETVEAEIKAKYGK